MEDIDKAIVRRAQKRAREGHRNRTLWIRMMKSKNPEGRKKGSGRGLMRDGQ